MRSLRHRVHEAELMDGADVSQTEFAACIEDLARVNVVTLAYRPTLAFVARVLDAMPSDQIPTIVDVGFGAGDMLRAVSRLIARKRRQARLIGFDINPRSEPVARRLTPDTARIDYRTGDAFAFAEPVDLAISSLVTHHMSDDEIVAFLRWMEERATRGWFVNDLHRHRLAYHGFAMLAAAMRWHRFVRHDGPLSIARSFRRSDWQDLLARADLAGAAQVRWVFPFRYCVERAKW